jgi:hypothetical protein
MTSLILLVALSTGCTGRQMKRLSDTEFDHFYALRPYMDEDARKAYLKLKTEEERNQFLKDKGLWDRFYQYDADQRDEIVAGAVQVGWTKDMVLMSWGAPYDKRKLAGRQATRSEALVYRFEQHEDGALIVWEPNSKTEYKAVRLFRREVILDDDVVAEIVEKDNWS